jgi:Transposase DDE domain
MLNLGEIKLVEATVRRDIHTGENIFDAFVQHSPMSVMMRGLMERILQPEKLDEIFARHGKLQYHRELLFSDLVNLMSLVVCGIHPSVNAAYKAQAQAVNVTRGAVYSKLNGVETAVSAGLLRETASELGGLIKQMGGAAEPLLPGYEVRILDGNALAATQRRLKVLQSGSSAPLPGKSLDEILKLRRIVLRLKTPSRHGDAEIVVLTNLPIAAATAQIVTQLYRERWQVERLFLTVTQNFEGEINTLAYPKAALFSFSLALVAYNLLATLRAALASVHGVGKIEASLSDFYLVDEIQGTYRGMMISLPPTAWLCFGDFALTDFVLLLQDLASKVDLTRFLKQPRQQKKNKPPLIKDPKHPHVSTAKLLSSR